MKTHRKLYRRNENLDKCTGTRSTCLLYLKRLQLYEVAFRSYLCCTVHPPVDKIKTRMQRTLLLLTSAIPSICLKCRSRLIINNEQLPLLYGCTSHAMEACICNNQAQKRFRASIASGTVTSQMYCALLPALSLYLGIHFDGRFNSVECEAPRRFPNGCTWNVKRNQIFTSATPYSRPRTKMWKYSAFSNHTRIKSGRTIARHTHTRTPNLCSALSWPYHGNVSLWIL